MNEQLLLDQIRTAGHISRADLARISSLSKNTVSLALANLERAGLVRTSGVRTGGPGPAALLYEVHPEAGFVLALDVGKQFLRGAIGDFSGRIRARSFARTRAGSAHARVTELVRLAESLYAEAGITAADITQTVLGSPGVYDPRRDALTLVSGLAGWEKPQILAELRKAFGDSLMVENDVNAAALAERAHGHGRDVDSFAFVWIGTGIGMGLVLDGRLHRGVHGAAGEIGYLPLDGATGTRGLRDARDPRDARRRSGFESAASAAGIVRAARDAGLRGSVSARRVFAAAARGDVRAAGVVADEAVLVARAICSVIAVVDPDLIVLGGGVGQAAGLIAPVERELRRLAPVLPELRVSALGADAVVDGCLAAGLERTWETVTVSP
ncbi:sugar kinase [Rugosimonospora africana]|uniref:Sugar kinase n=2 Tax=Rugosimonospora africana TaxID=556532 RepID=A0A8J3QNI7_9ACTN|nr:sugar kinase [Rugosimonospora africana]